MFWGRVCALKSMLEPLIEGILTATGFLPCVLSGCHRKYCACYGVGLFGVEILAKPGCRRRLA